MKYLSHAQMRNWPADKRSAVLAAAVRSDEIVVMLEDGEFARLAADYGVTRRDNNNVAASPDNTKIDADVVKARFEICKGCEDAREEGHGCRFHGACCFGAWRAKRESKCPRNKW